MENKIESEQKEGIFKFGEKVFTKNTIFALKVGERIFNTYVNTLLQCTYFQSLFKRWGTLVQSGLFNEEKYDYFLDRNPIGFEHILSYLRDNNHYIPSSYLYEVDFYGIKYVPLEYKYNFNSKLHEQKSKNSINLASINNIIWDQRATAKEKAIEEENLKKEQCSDEKDSNKYDINKQESNQIIKIQKVKKNHSMGPMIIQAAQNETSLVYKQPFKGSSSTLDHFFLRNSFYASTIISQLPVSGSEINETNITLLFRLTKYSDHVINPFFVFFSPQIIDFIESIDLCCGEYILDIIPKKMLEFYKNNSSVLQIPFFFNSSYYNFKDSFEISEYGIFMCCVHFTEILIKIHFEKNAFDNFTPDQINETELYLEHGFFHIDVRLQLTKLPLTKTFFYNSIFSWELLNPILSKETENITFEFPLNLNDEIIEINYFIEETPSGILVESSYSDENCDRRFYPIFLFSIYASGTLLLEVNHHIVKEKMKNCKMFRNQSNHEYFYSLDFSLGCLNFKKLKDSCIKITVPKISLINSYKFYILLKCLNNIIYKDGSVYPKIIN